MDGEIFDLLSDEYASEVISLMILERLWTKIKRHMDSKAEKKEADHLEKRLSDMETAIKVNTALDKERNK